MKIHITILFLIIALSPIAGLKAQDKSVITKVKKFKPPVVRSIYGGQINGAIVSKEDAIALLTKRLVVADSSNTTYPVVSFQFVYKSLSYVESDKPGKYEEKPTLTAGKFETTPLPKIWVDNLSKSLHKGEELFFFDILVKDKEGRLFKAPDLRITVK